MAKIPPKIIAEAVYRATKDKSGAELAQALKRTAQVLRDRRMLDRSEDVLRALQNIIEKKSGIVRARVTTAKKLQSGERIELEDEIREKYKAKTVAGEFFEKAELLGGMRVEVGDEVLDTTYQNKLHKLEKFLIKQA